MTNSQSFASWLRLFQWQARSKHLLTRITDTINSEHKRAAAFTRGLSNSIFTPNPRDKFNLSSAISTLQSLTPQDERSEHIRQHIECEKKICSQVIYQATVDKNTCQSTTLPALSLHLTGPILSSQLQYGKLSSNNWYILTMDVYLMMEDMNIAQHEKKYKKTIKTLPVYISTGGQVKMKLTTLLYWLSQENGAKLEQIYMMHVYFG